MIDIKSNVGSTFSINSEVFKLSQSEEMAGILALWKSEYYTIYAQPNFDGIGVPVDIWFNGESIGDNYYAPLVSSFDEYKNKVFEMSKEIIVKFERVV